MIILAALLAVQIPPYERRICEFDPSPAHCRHVIRAIIRKCGKDGANDWDAHGPVCDGPERRKRKRT